MSVRGRRHYVNLEGATFAYGKATLAEIVDPWDVATNVMEDITIPFAHAEVRALATHQSCRQAR